MKIQFVFCLFAIKEFDEFIPERKQLPEEKENIIQKIV